MTHQLWTSLIRYKVSPNLLYFLDCCRQKISPSEIIDPVETKRLAIAGKWIDDQNKLTMEAQMLLEEFETLLVKTKKKVSSDILGEDFLSYLNEYRNLFPAQRLPSGELARQSVQELKDKFIWFFKTFPEYNWDLVMDATDYYVYTKSKENYMYMATSSYFIHKVDPRTKVWKSLLADHCQMIQENPQIMDQG